MYFNKLCKYSIIITLCWLPLSGFSASNCSESESLKTMMANGNYRSALQEMDKCLAAFKQLSVVDFGMFNNIIKHVLTVNKSTSLEDVYRNFQSVLKIHRFTDLEFQFARYFKTHLKDDVNLFSTVRQADEKYYFYYDSGRVFSYSRGLALTDKSLIWKNIIEGPYRLVFDDIKSIKLIYEYGLSLTGWQLQVNNDENYTIRLSSVPDDAIIHFVSAVIYFINANKSSSDQENIRLELSEKEVAILAGWVTLCSNKYVELGSPIKDLQLLDACFSSYGKGFKLSKKDRELLNKFTTPILNKGNVPFEQGYNNFKVLLSTHFFSELDFQFKNNFDVQTQIELFKEQRQLSEQYQFYFEMGTVLTGFRGLALTDKSIIWKNFLGTSISWDNLTGLPSRLSFDKISSVTLVHEIGFQSITGWRLRFNKNSNHDIILTCLSEENVELFASALVYFINLASGANLTLEVPEETRAVLTKNFLERHPKIKSMADSIFDIIMPR